MALLYLPDNTFFYMRILAILILFCHFTFTLGVSLSVHRCATSGNMQCEVFGLNMGKSCVCSADKSVSKKKGCCEEKHVEVSPSLDRYLVSKCIDIKPIYFFDYLIEPFFEFQRSSLPLFENLNFTLEAPPDPLKRGLYLIYETFLI